MAERELPRFADLPLHADAPPGSSWGVWGDADEIGTLNLIEPAHVAAAARLVRRGAVFPLNWDLALPSPAFFLRQNPKHVMIEKFNGSATDDYLEGFWLQASSQWDGLRHFGDPDWGFYNRSTLTEVMTEGPGKLGIEKWAERGIAARGVLLDVARLLDAEGVQRDPFDWYPIDVALLRRTAAEQRVELRRGDVIVVRTGWIEAYEQLDEAGRQALAAEGPRPGCAGLVGDDVPGFLWDAGIAAVAADNPSLEAGHRAQGSDLSLHKALIARLGMPLGEFWDVQHLAADCAADGVYEFLLTSAPLRVGGGAGSPPNALALK